MNTRIKTLYQDTDIIVVDKPAGISTIPNPLTPREESLVGTAEKMCGQQLFVVHRLDKDTSGVVVFAKTKESHRSLNMEFDRRNILKKYLAVVQGRTGFDEQEVRIPISKSKIRSKKVALSSKGIEAITRLKTLERFNGYSLFEVIPVTGKRHQIRLHLKAIGHPLAIDPLYGRKEAIYYGELGTNSKTSEEVISRMPLHAESITFTHPTSGETMTVSASLPTDMKRFLDLLRENNRLKK